MARVAINKQGNEFVKWENTEHATLKTKWQFLSQLVDLSK